MSGIVLYGLIAIAAGHLLLAAYFIIDVLRQRFEPYPMLVWVLIIFFLPLAGSLFYLWLGESRIHARAQRARKAAHSHAKANRGGLKGPSAAGRFANVAAAAQELAGAPLTAGNSVAFYDDSEEIHQAWMGAVEAAERSISMQYYTWRPDDTGAEVRDLVAAKAQEGIQCRILVDSYGSSNLTRNFLSPLLDNGAKIAYFLPLSRWKRRRSPAMRNHRKILVVDDNIGFVGSQNVGDDSRERNGVWRDVHIEITGPAVAYVTSVFNDDWAVAHGERLFGPEPVPSEAAIGDTTIQIVPTGPDDDANVLERILTEAFACAEKSIEIASPYLVPSEVIRIALYRAARRGARVCIVLPEKCDQPLARYAARSFYRELIEAGVEIQEYSHGMLHSKIVAIDDAWAMIGSANMDLRSFRLNFEVSALVYEDPLVETIGDLMEKYCESARAITIEDLDRTDSVTTILEGAARILSSQL